ncbi:MmpS family transport accessory protein [Mycobacterium sp. NPDC006124]|uniref:MmpS family transport accessory protein n=1 Tax=Mycobacterium sp. NPDC006124 TaxID=3156729 RepID=UPI0033AA43CD
MVGIVKRAWIPLLIVVVVAIGGVVVYRMHGFFGSNNETTRPGAGLAQDAEPFNPKVVTYQITGTEGAVATINYLDLDATPQRVDDARLPWSITLRTTKPSASATIIAQSDGDQIGCRVSVDDVVRDEQSSTGVNAQVSCLVKSA